MDKGVISRGITAPMIKEGDNIVDIVVDAVLTETKVHKENEPGIAYLDGHYKYKGETIDKIKFDSKEIVAIPEYNLHHKDVIGITESVIARAAGQYVTVDNIAEDVIKKFGPAAVINVINPIYSRNRFSMILKGIARAASKIVFSMPPYDEVGNPSGVNPFTGVNIQEYYTEICKNENCEVEFLDGVSFFSNNWLYCGLHNYEDWKKSITEADSKLKVYTLADICSNVSPDWGLLGTNKSTEEKLKLFPSKAVAQKVCDDVKAQLKKLTGVDVIVMGYGDGCFHSPNINGISGTSIWEFADPVSFLPSSLDEGLLNSCPNEIKVKYLLDNKYSNLSGDELNKVIKNEISSVKENLKGKMVQEGCTPRRYGDLLASLMDLTSGSGSRCTPIVLVQHYFE